MLQCCHAEASPQGSPSLLWRVRWKCPPENGLRNILICHKAWGIWLPFKDRLYRGSPLQLHSGFQWKGGNCPAAAHNFLIAAVVKNHIRRIMEHSKNAGVEMTGSHMAVFILWGHLAPKIFWDWNRDASQCFACHSLSSCCWCTKSSEFASVWYV